MDDTTGPIADDKGSIKAVSSSSVRSSLVADQDSLLTGDECWG